MSSKFASTSTKNTMYPSHVKITNVIFPLKICRGDISVKVRVSEVVPESGRTVSEVERGFYESDEVKEKTEEVGHMLNKQHDEMKVKGISHQSISYAMSCRSLDALECLMGRYENGKLQDLMEDEFLSDELLDKIGAFYLAIDVTIDYEAYFSCRKELIKDYGIPTHDVKQQTDHGTTKSAEPLKTYTSLGRVNRARDLLKDFQREGDDVIESQIRMLDQLLQDKEEMRKVEYQKSLQQSLIEAESFDKDFMLACQQHRLDDAESTQMTDVLLLTDEEIEQKNEELEAKVNELMISSGIGRSRYREKGRGREIGKAVAIEGAREEESKLNPILREFIRVKSETRDLATNHSELAMKTKKLSAYADRIVGGAEIPDETKGVYIDVRRVEKGIPVKRSVLEVFRKGLMPGQFNGAYGIHIKNNCQWVICDVDNHRVQVIDPVKLRCDLILQFHAFQSFYPLNVTVDEDNDKYIMSDSLNGQVVVSSAQSKILDCFGLKEGIDPRGICLSPDGFIFIGDWNGYVRKYNESGEHIARTEKGRVSQPCDLIVNKKFIFVSDYGRKCVHVLNHQMQSIRDIGKGHLEGPYGLCFDHQQDGIYVCDYDGNRVVHFNYDGEFLSYKGQGQLEEPRYIALCKDNPYSLVVTQYYSVKLLYI